MSRNGLKIFVVAAASSNNGIGINGKLPWRLEGDMAHFKRITTATVDIQCQNAVIMGRKTWYSLPVQFRPLPGRVNVVLSRTLSCAPEGAILASGIDDALQKLDDRSQCPTEIENIFIIGGSAVYDAAFKHPLCKRIYLTRILREYDWDACLPEFDRRVYGKVSVDGIRSDVQSENGIEYRFEVLQKVF